MALKEVGLVEGVSFSQQDALPIITVENSFATAKITPYGACILSFIPKSPVNALDLLWVSPIAEFSGQKPVRGGIPICWPWFGKHSANPVLPAHGFVRNLVWTVSGVRVLGSGATELIFSIQSSDETLKLWPYCFHLTLTVVIAETLSLCLTTTNLSEQEMVLTEAFHSYFSVSDTANLEISGLEGSLEIDTLDGMSQRLQKGRFVFSPPIDSVFAGHSGSVIIEDSGFSRRINIQKQCSSSTIVWNPGTEIVKSFKDIPDNQWPEFLCVESGNVFKDTVVLMPNEMHKLKMQLSY